MRNNYLFVLCAPFSGSTALWRLLSSSSSISTFPSEGQRVEKAKHILFAPDRWDPDKKIPWQKVKEIWEQEWDMKKAVLLEKSPPNLCRAFDVEKNFPNAHFVIMHRTPYAFAEVLRRKNKTDIKKAAEFWVKIMQWQKKNIEGLKNKIYFSYADFTMNPQMVYKKITRFIPELKDIDINTRLKVHGRNEPLTNFDNIQLRRLSDKDVKEINSVLYSHKDIMTFFKYEYMKQSVGNHYGE